jgi:RNA recognition motif-containing protein
MNVLRISGLPQAVTDTHLKDLFAPFGKVVFAQIFCDPKGHSLGCGVVEMSCQEEVEEILFTKDRISVGGIRPNIWRSLTDPTKVQRHSEVLISWKCGCATVPCLDCNDKKYLEEWIPSDLLKALSGLDFIIRGRR